MALRRSEEEIVAGCPDCYTPPEIQRDPAGWVVRCPECRYYFANRFWTAALKCWNEWARTTREARFLGTHPKGDRDGD